MPKKFLPNMFPPTKKHLIGKYLFLYRPTSSVSKKKEEKDGGWLFAIMHVANFGKVNMTLI